MLSINSTTARLSALSLLVVSTFHLLASHQINHRYLQQEQEQQQPLQLSTHRGFGTHYITLQIGNPAQPVRLAVSTGSDFTALPCIGCQGVENQVDKSYNYNLSGGDIHMCPDDCVFASSRCLDGKTDGTDQCMVKVTFDPLDDMTGGYKGIEISSQVYIDTEHTPVLDNTGSQSKKPSANGFLLDFVCQTELKGDMSTETLALGGILGMSTAPTSFLHQMYLAGKIKQRIFSLCFRGFQDYQPNGVSAGQVTFGGYDPTRFDTPLVWVKNTANIQHLSTYAVHIRRIYMGLGGGDEALQRAAQGTMSILPIDMDPVPIDAVEVQGSSANVDYSGLNGEDGVVLIQTNTPTTCLHKSIEAGFKKAFHSMTGIEYEPEMKIGRDQFEMLPTVLLQFESHAMQQGGISVDLPGFVGRHDHNNPYDILLAVPPSHYLLYDGETAIATLVFGETSSIGANILQKHEIIFDLERDRIGLAERRDCPEGVTLFHQEMSSLDTRANNMGHLKGSASASGHIFEITANSMIPGARREESSTGLGHEIDDGSTGRNGHITSHPVLQEGMDGGSPPLPSVQGNPVNTTPVEIHQFVSMGLPSAETGNFNYPARIATPSSSSGPKASSKVTLWESCLPVLGFCMFCVGFFVTAIATQDCTKSLRPKRRVRFDDAPVQDDSYDTDGKFGIYPVKDSENRKYKNGKERSKKSRSGRRAFFRRDFARHEANYPSSTPVPDSTSGLFANIRLLENKDRRNYFIRSSSDSQTRTTRESTRSSTMHSINEMSSVGAFIEGQSDYMPPSNYKAAGFTQYSNETLPSIRSSTNPKAEGVLGKSFQSFGTEPTTPSQNTQSQVGPTRNLQSYYRVVGTDQSSAIRTLSSEHFVSSSQGDFQRPVDSTEQSISALLAVTQEPATCRLQHTLPTDDGVDDNISTAHSSCTDVAKFEDGEYFDDEYYDDGDDASYYTTLKD